MWCESSAGSGPQISSLALVLLSLFQGRGTVRQSEELEGELLIKSDTIPFFVAQNRQAHTTCLSISYLLHVPDATLGESLCLLLSS